MEPQPVGATSAREAYPERARRLLAPHRELAWRLAGREGVSSAFRKLLMGAYSGALVRADIQVGLLASSLLYVALVQHLRRLETPFTGRIPPDAELDGMCSLARWAYPHDVVEGTLIDNRHQAWHELGGRRLYEVSPGLASRLTDTQLRGLTTDDLRLPFESLYLAIPPQARLYVHAPEVGDFPCEGTFITEDAALPAGRAWHFCFVGVPSGGRSALDEALHYFTVELPPGMPLDDALARSGEAMALQSSGVGTRPDREAWGRLFAFAMNAVLYATGHASEQDEVFLNARAASLREQLKRHPSGSGKHERARKELRVLDPLRRIYLGRGFQPEPPPSIADGDSSSVTVLTRVQGHWRLQSHGTQGALRKRIWVQPYWRGPEDTPLVPPGRHVLQ